MSLTLHTVDADGLAPWCEGLRRLEHGMLYPIGDGADMFRIDHGPRYHPPDVPESRSGGA